MAKQPTRPCGARLQTATRFMVVAAEAGCPTRSTASAMVRARRGRAGRTSSLRGSVSGTSSESPSRRAKRLDRGALWTDWSTSGCGVAQEQVAVVLEDVPQVHRLDGVGQIARDDPPCVAAGHYRRERQAQLVE